MSESTPPAGAVALSDAARHEIEAFLYLEARLADESRYAEWEALVSDDMHYWVPKGAANYDPATRLSYINDNRARLATRIRQLQTGLHHAQTPPSPMRRIISNIEVIAADEAAGIFVVGSNFVLYEVAAQATGQLRIWPGRVTHHLRRVEGRLQMSEKIVELVTGSLPQPNMAFLL